MGKDIIIRGQTYLDAESVAIPLASGQGDADFYDVSDVTLDSGGKMLNGVTARGPDGTLYTGTIESKSSSDLSASGPTVNVPAGHYASPASKAVASGSASPAASISGTGATVSTGTNTLTLTKSVQNTPAVDPGYVAQGTAGNSSLSLTANVTTKAASTITPGTSDQEIAAGTYLTGKQTIKGDSNLKGENIVAGKRIFNTDGTAQIPVISYDTTNHKLSIS